MCDEAPCPGPPPDPCSELLEQIKNLARQIAFRVQDLRSDIHDLFLYHRTLDEAHPTYGSYEGHQIQVDEKKNRLNRLIRRHRQHDRCPPPPGGYPVEVEIEVPEAPDPKPPVMPVVETAATAAALAGAGYILYRVVRFLPSLAFPLSIPVNLAVP